MKKNFLFLATLFLMIFLISGCSSNYKGNKSKIQLKKEMFATFSHGILSPDPETRELPLNEKEISVLYNIANGEKDASFGLLIFVDGILQPYHVNGNKKSSTMSEFNLSKNQNQTIPVSFTPIQHTQNSIVNFLLVLNPSFFPKEKTKKFGHNHTISQLIPWKLKSIIKDQDFFTNNIIEFKNYYFTKIEKNNKKTNLTNKKFKAPLELNINSNNNMVFDTNNKEYIIPLNIFSGSNGKYRISIYLNHNLIKAFDNHEYLDIDCEKETVYNLCFSIDPDNIKNNNHMYAIAVPIDYEYENSICEVVKSDSVVITIN